MTISAGQVKQKIYKEENSKWKWKLLCVYFSDVIAWIELDVILAAALKHSIITEYISYIFLISYIIYFFSFENWEQTCLKLIIKAIRASKFNWNLYVYSNINDYVYWYFSS